MKGNRLKFPRVHQKFLSCPSSPLLDNNWPTTNIRSTKNTPTNCYDTPEFIDIQFSKNKYMQENIDYQPSIQTAPKDASKSKDIRQNLALIKSYSGKISLNNLRKYKYITPNRNKFPVSHNSVSFLLRTKKFNSRTNSCQSSLSNYLKFEDTNQNNLKLSQFQKNELVKGKQINNTLNTDMQTSVLVKEYKNSTQKRLKPG